jgi:Aromatic acid exporter family member 1
MRAADLRRLAHDRSRDPVFWADVLQVVKTVAAAVLAWVVATRLLHLPQSFLAPWAALLVVHATVYRTFSEGARQVGATVLGVLLAWAAGNTLGLNPMSVAVATAAGLALSAVPWLSGEGTTVAATAVIVLTTGSSHNDLVLLSRLGDTAIGIMTGLLVNLAVWPPLRARTAIVAMDALDADLGELLGDMGDGLATGCAREDVRGWIDRTRDLDEDLDRAWSLVRQARESALMNPRRSAGPLRDPQQWMALLRRLEQALAETRSMAQTLEHGMDDAGAWESLFREPYVALLRDAGHAIAGADPGSIRAVRDRLNDLVDRIGEERPVPRLWPVYGGLIINLRNIMDAMDEVAAANPMSQPPLPFHRPRA